MDYEEDNTNWKQEEYVYSPPNSIVTQIESKAKKGGIQAKNVIDFE